MCTLMFAEVKMQYDDEVLRRLQLVELQILKDIDRVCREQGITYFLDSGTLLGAVRHQGFIPWDDDIDIGMMRSDYDRFMAAAAEALGENYVVSSCELRADHAAMFAKVWRKDTKFSTRETVEAGVPQGIFVDVFPYDELCANPAKASKQVRACRFWQSVSYLYHAKTIIVPHEGLLGWCEKLGCRVAHVLARLLFTHEGIRVHFDKGALMGRDDPSSRAMAFAYPVGEGFPLDVLLPTKDISFEGCTFSGPAEAERYLEIMFGDWRTLPPEGKRKNHAPLELDFGENATAH
ncbi:LicD family protein [Gordonibacter urolithinfaciens]|jgi:lipopolysaccharide cholinephosphotransferase|uniref:LicD family protein n=1 Tax=Gordonibacter urolithinfaciens TaxID=1335613 RepID=UPI0023AB099C|nr:LicD family protein [Gordonibacter urolithinfaciens]